MCFVDGCEKPIVAHKLCSTHYKRWKKHGDPGPAETSRLKNRICSVEGCDRSYFARDFCQMHYHRWQRHGDPGSAEPAIICGQVVCSVEGCNEPYRCNGFCIKHQARWMRYGDPLARHNDEYDVMQYAGAHGKVRMAKGLPSQHLCEHCGKQAEEWSYKGSDPDELIGVDRRNGELRKYSLNIDYYQPLCVPCHRRFDLRKHDYCTVDGCGRSHCALGLCRMHYKRQYVAKRR